MGWRWDTLPERTWDQWKYYGIEMGNSPGVNRLKILPSDASGILSQRTQFDIMGIS